MRSLHPQRRPHSTSCLRPQKGPVNISVGDGTTEAEESLVTGALKKEKQEKMLCKQAGDRGCFSPHLTGERHAALTVELHSHSSPSLI